jgi:hypothetical protein
MNCDAQTIPAVDEPLLTVRINWPAVGARLRSRTRPIANWRARRIEQRRLRATYLMLADMDCRTLEDIAFSCEQRDVYAAHRNGMRTRPTSWPVL